MFSLLFILIVLPIFLFLFNNFYFKRRNLPPGPTPLPLIGNMLDFLGDVQPERKFLEWRRQFGDLYTIWMGQEPIVCVTGFAKIMETFQRDGDAYVGRMDATEIETLTKGGLYGITAVEGDLWREQRRFVLHTLRDFGLGKNLMEEKILGEIGLMYARIDRKIGTDTEMDLVEHFNVNIGSIINTLMFGYRWDDDKLHEFHELKALLKAIFDQIESPLTMICLWRPRLFHRLPIFKAHLNKWILTHQKVLDFFGRQIQVHLAEMDEKMKETALLDEEAPTDLVEAFFREKRRKDAIGEQHGFSIDQLKVLCFDIWTAGQITIGITLAWAIDYLLNHPQCQAKLHAELDAVIADPDRLITMAQRPALPYTIAVINETQRKLNLFYFNVMRTTSRDVVIDGHFLPKGTAIVPQIGAIMANEEIFENPDQFDPDRFLDENGKLKRVDEFMPFSVGKRQCLGEALARMELFLFLANLFNKYKILPGHQGLPSMKRKFQGMVQAPEKFMCRIEKRQMADL